MELLVAFILVIIMVIIDYYQPENFTNFGAASTVTVSKGIKVDHNFLLVY